MAAKLASQDAGIGRPGFPGKTVLLLGLLLPCAVAMAQSDGIQAGPPRAGGNLPGLTAEELAQFVASTAAFVEADSVKGAFVSPVFGVEKSAGLGPRFNMVGCAGCHAQPAAGGTSPFRNPQIDAATDAGARNVIPPFITLTGPVREVRFKSAVDADGNTLSPIQRDGGVHALFTITGRSDAPGCSIPQAPFARVAAQNNLSFRIPTPLFGLGLVEAISDGTILQSFASTAFMRGRFAINGHPNRSGNDGNITKFGWKAQNVSLTVFAGEAYNVEQGVTNELFINERDNEPVALPAACYFNAVPEDRTQSGTSFETVANDLVKFATFMRLLAPPAPTCDSFANPSNCPTTVQNGRNTFTQIGCALCHTAQLAVSPSYIGAITNQRFARLFSDLLVHRMGTRLADGISQGAAGDDEFRTAPLWGVGQRIFFLHDGRTTSLTRAIQEHASDGSEANGVIERYNDLSSAQQQDLINFLRSL